LAFEVVILRGKVEILPYLTVMKSSVTFDRDIDQSPPELTATITTPDQIELRKAKAGDIGNMGLLLAGRYYRRTALEKVRSILERVIPPTSESLWLKGNTYWFDGERQKAEGLYKQVIALDSTNVWALYARENTIIKNARMRKLYRNWADNEKDCIGSAD